MKKIFLMLAFVMAVVTLNAQRTTVKVSDLPKNVSDYVAKDYAGFTISGASKIVAGNVETFEVVITKGTVKNILSFDNSGKFLKKVGSEARATTKKGPAPMGKNHHALGSKAPVKK